MVLSYVLVAVLAIACYEAISAADGRDAGLAERLVRTAIVVGLLVAALPLGAFLGAATISALTEHLAVGALVLGGSATVVSMLGLGLYIVAEGELPSVLRPYVPIQ